MADRLHELGIDRLAAIVITHDQSDHAGDLGELLGSVHVDRLVYGAADVRGCAGPRSRPAQRPTGSRRAASSTRAGCA